jgi:DNA topoisomerase IA
LRAREFSQPHRDSILDLTDASEISLLNQGGFERPRNGKKNDKAHPPIHPTAHVNNLAGEEKKVYELIVRRFLGCCSKNAKGLETTCDIEIAGEAFSAKGLLPPFASQTSVLPS